MKIFESTEGPLKGHNVEPIYFDIELTKDKLFSYKLPSTHNTFIYLINGEIKPTSEKQISFIKKVKDYKTAIPKNIHEKVYFKYMKFFFDKNSKKKEIIEDKIWKNIETNSPGTMQYSQEMIDRLNTEYEPISKNDWYDDWKYN